MLRMWPDELPEGVGPGYRLSPQDQSLRTDMEVGPKRLRRITRDRRDLAEVSWVLTDIEFAAFRAWYGDEAWSLAGDSDSLAPWTPTAAELLADHLAGPDLALADALVESEADSAHHVALDLVALDGAELVLAVTASSASRALQLALIGRDGVARAGFFDLAAGTMLGQSGLTSRRMLDRGDGWWRCVAAAPVGTGISAPQMRLALSPDGVATSYEGDGSSGAAVCEIMARVTEFAGLDPFLRTDAAGLVTGAAGGSAWVLLPLAFGGGLRVVEGRFDSPWTAEAQPGLNWQVSARMEIRNA